MPDLLSIIKQAAMEAVENSQPAAVMYGTVKSESPLTVLVEQKMTLTSEFLVVPEHLTNREYDVTVSAGYGWKTTAKSGGGGDAAFASHDHEITVNKQKIFVYNALKSGDKIALIRAPGGQQFLIVDRIPK